MTSKKRRILIVDDEPVIRDLLNEELSERGYLCTTASNGDEALSRLAKQSFDVVLLDIRLPGMSGIEVLREIWLNHGDTAPIMITAVNDVTTLVEAMKLGALDYIVKPFDLDRVDTSIRTALETRQATDKSAAQMDAIASGVEAKLDPLFDYSRLVTEIVTDIALQLGISEEEIEQWAEAKAKLDSRRRSGIAASPGKPR